MTVFDKLEEYGICVPRTQRIFPWFIVYDFEAMLVPIQGEGSEKLSWTAQHIPISVSICSNVDGFTSPKCIVDPDTDTLVGSMVEYMQLIATKGDELAREKFQCVFEELNLKMQNPVLDLQYGEHQPDQDEIDNHIETISTLKDAMDDYCRQMICLGFNSSKYDMNLIKSRLAKHLNLDTDNVFTVKKTTNTTV